MATTQLPSRRDGGADGRTTRARASGPGGGETSGDDRPTPRREVLLLLSFLAVYSLVRQLPSDDVSLALRNARTVLGAERGLGLDVEARLNQAVAQLRWLEIATSYWYASLHYVVTPLVLVLLYRRRPDLYRPARTALGLATATALLGYLLYPTAPPRLLPGYVDVLLDTSSAGWWSSEGSAVRGAAGLVNELAAMPSMHVGWALWCGVVLAWTARHRWQQALGLFYPLVTTLVVLVTANHWTLDAVAGGGLVCTALVLVRARSSAVSRSEEDPVPTPAGTT